MATTNLSKLASSSEIFSGNHTLPQIRAIHNSIHAQIDEKATRLRTQVGNSYRELLGTADTIVRMRADNDEVQELLGHMGSRCGRGVVRDKASGLADFAAKEDRPDVTEAARLKLLDSCLLVCGRILKGGGGVPSDFHPGDRMVLAAKVYVLSRLLIKSLRENSSDPRLQQTVQTAEKTLNGLRRRLLGSVKKVLERTDDDADRADVLKALCAYSLATSSGAWDVLRHFLSTRAGAMAVAFELEEGERGGTTEDVVQSLKLYTKTILDVQALVPLQLAPALVQLKEHPLLADEVLKQLEGLRLDVYQRWCGDEIRYFTPYLRHDDLDGKQAKERLSNWAKTGAEVLLGGLKKTLAQMADFKSIVELRTQVLQHWIRDGGKAKGFDPLEMQDDLRSAINARLLAVLVSKVSKLRLVGSEVKATLESWETGEVAKHPALWDEAGYDGALSHGAASFVQEVVSRLYGRNDAVSRALNGYTSWFHVIDDVTEVVEMLRKQRWDNDYDEIEDEETIEARQQVLSKDDPKTMHDRLNSALDKAFKELQEHLVKLWDERSDGPNNGAVAIYLLRVLRDIRGQLPDRPAVQTFGLSLVPALHSQVVKRVSASALQQFAGDGLSEKRVITRPLWEGSPPLPNQPSSSLFQFLRALSLDMADAGVDLWTPVAVAVMKRHVSERQAEMWRKAIDGISEDTTKEEETTPSQDEEKESTETAVEESTVASGGNSQDLYVQWSFDVSLLLEYLSSSSGTTENGLNDILVDIYKLTALEDDALRQRITKAAHEFWQRTSLLFGLLA